MKKAIVTLALWLSNGFNKVALMLKDDNLHAKKQSKFVDLAPTDKADENGVYSEAMLFATSNLKVSNIALTGPYGSGKSSIIQSFLRSYRGSALHISLASFAPDTDSGSEKVNRQDIERSILQQMLYGADANKLPLSRFKRIQSPSVWSNFISFFITLGVFGLWYIFHQHEEIISGVFFTPFALSNWFNFGTLIFLFIFLWRTLHHFYVASFGLSLKSISLKDVEIKPALDDQASILNRHLDEIVYFFQSTNYDLVIIEDLDRFNNADIFVTLREINSLVNENAGVKRTIRFLYALRDDMFENTERTKFFEFIIPVVPIINTSNSIDMVLRQGRRLELDGRLDSQFLREVSRYLNDLRLIQNIFNEYAIYVANLETDGESLLDANKLLAVLIYKNVYPKDFEQLHRGTGTLAEILKLQDKLIEDSESIHRNQIVKLETSLEVAEQQIPSDHRELRQIYAMALIEQLPVNTSSVSIDQQNWISLHQLANHDAFEQLTQASQLFHLNLHNRRSRVDVSNWQNEVDSQKSYEERKREIERKAAGTKNKTLQQIRDLRSKIANIRTIKFNELLRLNADRVEYLFEDLGEHGDLARFLILEGHLDDTYYQYTSLFHSGRLSPNDNKFLIQIRAFVTPEPSFPIDNPKEVIAAMRDADFRQSFVLNVKLVDSLLGERSHYRDQTQKLFEFISSEFGSCEGFLDAYYTRGREVLRLLSGLADQWKGLVPAAIASPNNTYHVTQLVTSLPETSLKALAKDFDELPEFVSDNLPGILVNAPEVTPERLLCLNFEIKEFAEIKEHSEIVRSFFERGLFALTLQNLEYIYHTILGENDLDSLREKNFTTIRSLNNTTLLNRVRRDFSHYVGGILLGLQDNSKEDASAILYVVCDETLDQDDLRDFLEMQTNQLPTLADVPEKLHAMLFKYHVIEPTWKNCLTYMEGEEFEPHTLVEYLDHDDVRRAILKQPIPSNDDSKKLRLFLFEASALSDRAYEDYANALPRPIKYLPDGLEPTKLRILIDKGKVTFSKESFDALADDNDLQVLFVVANIESYLEDPNIFTLDDEFLEALLRSELDDATKLRIVELMNLEVLTNLPKRAALIGSILEKTDSHMSTLNGGIAQSLIINSMPIATQISLFNKYQSLLTDEEVRNVLANLPKPFSEIRNGYNRPRLENTLENRNLAEWLKSRRIISSWSDGGILTSDIVVNLFRR